MTRLTLIAVSLVFSASGAEYHLQLSPEHTQVNWTLGDVLHTVHGTFKLKRGEIFFDPESGKASGEVVVDSTSGNSGSDARDSRMHKDVLESAKFPEILFLPDRVDGRLDLAGTSNIKLYGTFKIHGADHELTAEVQVTAKDGQLLSKIKFVVPFVAWGMKDPSRLFLKVDKSVEIEMESSGRLMPK